MGDEIILKAIEVIQDGLLQIDLWNETERKEIRFFAEPKEFFNMLGNAMQKNFKQYQIKDGWVLIEEGE